MSMASVTGWVIPPGTPQNDPVDAVEWITVTAAMTRAGVSRRTIRRWIAASTVESKLTGEDGRELRLIRADTLPTGDTRDDTHASHRDGTKDSHGASEGDSTGDTHFHDTVTRQAEEIAFLRAQVERRDQAEAELRRLLLSSQNALALALEQRSLPPAPDPPRRLKWWRLWTRS